METVSFTQIGVFIGCLIVLVALAAAVKSLFHREPPLHREYITRDEVEKIEKRLTDDLTKQAGSRKDIHKDIDQLRVGQGRLEVKTEELGKQLTNLDDKMDRVLLRLPRIES
ncbi:hypothetical protein [Opitutus terrae]|uniref:Uncharacterized protein n=1 Tax=Opitutus terrae (strain DSM 11246 / JCM 15787 / PB90-1) TaxID=452637 RepID=B1ZUC7_OPITP|nr:hypothetical protein [Opitutus terrae]ACB76689.1 hypothetical protein Oter_3412 [Opitutus terrae PB90-1]